MPKPKLQITFSPPRHGWLPVRLDLSGRVLEFPAFRGPNNPVKETYRAVAAALRGDKGVVWWHLDPDGYFFELTRAGRLFHLRVQYAAQSLYSPKRDIAVLSGSAEEIVHPLLHALREFDKLAIDSEHWRHTEFPELAALEQAALESCY